jgi:hypothetical protein
VPYFRVFDERGEQGPGYHPGHACQVDEPLPAGTDPVPDRRAGSLVWLPAQGGAAHLLCQSPEPCRPGDDLGGAAARTARHHAADCRKDYWTKTPFKQWITTAVFNAVYVERERTGDEDPLQPLFDALEHGDSLIIFPEGTRGNAEEPQPFKAGLYNLTCKFPEVVLVPAWINNVQRVMPKGEVVPVPILCSVTFGAPIRLEPGEERRAFLDRARLAVMALRDV